jgi:hypothetical protein
MWAADVALKLHRAAPHRPGDAMDACLEFSSLMLRIAQVLPCHEVAGLGEDQRGVLSEYIKVSNRVVEGAVRYPAERLTLPIVELVRALAQGSDAETAETGFVPGHGVPNALRLNAHFYGGSYAHKLHMQTGLARAELAYMVYLSGAKRLRRLDMPEFHDMLDNGLETVAWSMAMWVPALLFDGARLHIGVEIARCKAPRTGALANRNVLPRSGETCLDQERTHKAAQLLLAMCEEGAANYNTDAPGKQAMEDHCSSLRGRVDSALLAATSGARVPGKAMRAIVDAIAHDIELAVAQPCSHGALVYRAAFAHPCLLIESSLADAIGLESRAGAEQGAAEQCVCLWEACRALVHERAGSSGQLLSVQAALSAVLGCVVAGLVDASLGRIRVDPSSGVARLIGDMQRKWPRAVPQGARLSPTRTEAKPRGKAVGLTAALRNMISVDPEQQHALRAEPKSSNVSLERLRAALTMRSIVHSLSSAGSGGAADPLPTEGVVGLKRLYLAALHADPGTYGAYGCGQLGPGATSPFCDASVTRGHCALAIPASSTEMVWREVSGGALTVCGMLFPFTRHALHASLNEDWSPLCNGAAASTKGVMLPVVAVNLVGWRAKKGVREMAMHVQSSVSDHEGPIVAVRSAEALDAFARAAFSHPVSALWEVLVSHVASRPAERLAGCKRAAPG